MKKFILLAMLSSLTVMSYLRTPLESKPLNVAPSAEEYSIYSALLNRYETTPYGKRVKLYVICDLTKSASRDKCSPEKMLESGPYAEIIAPDFRPAIKDYNAKNEQNFKLGRSLKTEKEYLLIRREEFNSYFTEKGNGWERYYKQYEESPGFITFSRVGFNAERTRAIVYVEILCENLCADGSYIMLVKENGFWKEDISLNCWAS